jgi:hypothetical protein
MASVHHNLAVSSDSIMTLLNTLAPVSPGKFPPADRLGVNERHEGQKWPSWQVRLFMTGEESQRTAIPNSHIGTIATGIWRLVPD